MRDINGDYGNKMCKVKKLTCYVLFQIVARLPNYTPCEKVLLAAYERLLTTEPLIQGREIKLCAPIPILKSILTGKPLPLMVAQETAVQQWALYILHEVTSDGMNKENK